MTREFLIIYFNSFLIFSNFDFDKKILIYIKILFKISIKLEIEFDKK